MSNAYYPQAQTGYPGPPPPAYGQPQFTGPYAPQPGQPTVIMQQPAQPQYVVVEEHRPAITGADCCCLALCAFCCGLCLSN